MKTLAQCVLAAIVSVLCVANAKAVPITYTESAIVTGSLAGTSFPANELLTLTGTGDTTNITSPSGGFFVNNVAASFTLSVSVGGVGGGTFTGPIQVFDFQGGSGVAGFTDAGVSQDILDTINAAFLSYALSTSIGPITGSGRVFNGNTFSTSAGTLNLSTAGDATFTAVVTPVPLPAALPLFATGLGALGLLGWRRKKKAAALTA